ncbi:MAG: glycosyltransferase, partial [Candidatus Sulfotelmatobacter sp.]
MNASYPIPRANRVDARAHVLSPIDSNPSNSSNIFLMTDSFQTGGSERQFAGLARALRASGCQLTVGSLQLSGSLPTDLGPIQHFDLGGSLYGLQSIRTRYRLASDLRRSRIAIAHSFDYYTNLTLIPAARFVGTPVVIGSQRQLGDLLTGAQNRAQLAMFRWSDCVICNSHAAAKRLVHQGLPPDKIAVIWNGLPASAFARATPIVPPRAGSCRVGMIARMNAHSKNHAFLLQVAARLRARVQTFELVLVGDGPLRKQLESRAEQLGIRNFVQFLGNREDVPAVLASLDVTVLPSSSESLSNAILESMAAGVVVIASDVGGNAELVGEGRGILVPPGDESAFENALETMIGDTPFRERVGINAAKFAKENFT